MSEPIDVEALLDVLARAAVGDRTARVAVDPGKATGPADALGNAINVLLSDLAGQRERDEPGERAAAAEARAQLLGLLRRQLHVPRAALAGLEPGSSVPPELAAALSKLATSVGHLEELSGIERGTVVPAEQPVVLRALVEDRLAVAREHTALGVTLTAEIDGAVPAALLGDAHRLAQMLDAVLAAATSTTQAGAITVAVSAEAADGWCVVRIAVIDTGDGIPPAALRRVLDPYGGPSLGVAGLEHELGLRLAVARRVAEAAGGRLEIESVVGLGTSAEIVLPLADGTGTSAERAG